jgi:hypothetical protein
MAGRFGSLLKEKGVLVGGTRDPAPRKQLVVDLGSLTDNGEPWVMALSALEKAYRAGWSISYWTAITRKRYGAVVKHLQDSQFWNYIDPESEDFLLMRYPSLGEVAVTTKLTLLEQNFGHDLDSGKRRIVLVESDLDTARALKAYALHRISIHLSPRVWLNLTAVGPEMLDAYLWRMGLSEECAKDSTLGACTVG